MEPRDSEGNGLTDPINQGTPYGSAGDKIGSSAGKKTGLQLWFGSDTYSEKRRRADRAEGNLLLGGDISEVSRVESCSGVA
jgi:hypothetical protein